MNEYKTIRVNPNEEEYAIRLYTTFGWQLVDSQEFYSESTEIDDVEIKAYGNDFFGGFMKGFTGRDGNINVKTSKNITNYISMRFVRDTEMNNYTELCNLFDEYMSLVYYNEPKKPVKITAASVIGVAIIIVSLIMALVQRTKAEIWEICVCVLFPLIMIPLTIYSWFNYRKKTRNYEIIENRISEIITQALSLSN